MSRSSFSDLKRSLSMTRASFSDLRRRTLSTRRSSFSDDVPTTVSTRRSSFSDVPTRRSSFSDMPRSQSMRYAATSPKFTDVQRPRGQKKKGALKEMKGALNKIFKGLFKSKKKHLSENAETGIPRAPANSEASDHDPIPDNITEEEESFITPRNSFEFVIPRNLEIEEHPFWKKM
ncbi:hypothetical protein CsatB_015799 [Cannabis sativa]